MSRKIFERFADLPEARRSTTLMAFLNFGTEVIMDPFVEWAWQQGKRVAVPLCLPETREMIISLIETFDDVEPGYFGIREPKRDRLRPVPREQLDLILVPAVAFDRNGYRVGYGGGYYDRLLSEIRDDVPKIGIVFSCQIVTVVPVDQYDLPVDTIITEREVITIKPKAPGQKDR